jgi:hypothetical protein
MMLREAVAFGVRCALAGAFVAAAAAASAAPPDAQAVAARAAALVEADRHGIIATITDTTERIEAPIYHQSTHSRYWVVAENGVSAAAGYLLAENNGKPESHDELVKDSASFDASVKNRANAAHSVLRPEYLGEYRIADAPCEGCTEGERAVHYESDKHDGAHGNGTIVVDASGHVVRTISHPYVFPKYINDGGEFTTRYGMVLDGKRLPVETTGAYHGHRGPMKGTDTYEQRFSYKRFATVEEAVAATKLPG